MGLAGNVVFALCQWLIIVVMARWSSPTVVGQYALAVVITTPIVVATNLQLRNIVAAGTVAEVSFRRFLLIRLATVPLDILLVGIVLLAGGWGLVFALVTLALLLAKEIEAASDLMYGYMLRVGLVRHMAGSLILRGLGGLGAFASAIAISGSLAISLLALAGAWGAVALALDGPRGRRHGRRLDPPASVDARLTKVLRHGVPLGLASLIVVIGTSVPRLIVERDIGTAGLGVYTALAFTVTGGAIVVNSMCQMALPRLAADLRLTNIRSFYSKLARLLGGAGVLGVSLIVLAMSFGAPFLRVVYGRTYSAYEALLVWLLVAGALTYVASVVGWALIAAGRTRGQLLSTALGTASIIAASVVLVPRYGLRGAAWAAAVGMVIQALAGAAVLRRFLAARNGAPAVRSAPGTTFDG